MEDQSTTDTQPISTREAWLVALVATLTMSVSYVDRQALAALAPVVTDKLHIDDAAYGWLQSAFSIAYLVGSPLAGSWIDRAGARRGLVASMMVWTFVASVHALAPSLHVLFAMRIALGLAESPGFPGSAQTVQRILPPAQRSAGFGVLFTGSSIGAAIAPPLAVGLQNHFGWRFAFLLTAVIGLVWIPLWMFVTRAPHVRAVLDRREDARTPSTRPTFDELLRHPAVLRAVVLVIASAPLIAFLLLWPAKYLHAVFHLPQSEMGHYLWLPPLMFDLGSVAFGMIATRRDVRDRAAGLPRRQHTVLIFAATALALVGCAIPLTRDVWTMVIVAGVALAGGGALFALLTADMLARVPPRIVSTAGGLTAAAQSLAYIVANVAIGAIVKASHSYRGVVIGLSVLVLPGMLFWVSQRGRVLAEGGTNR